MLDCVALCSSGASSQASEYINFTPIELMVSELNGATEWDFVSVFPCEDICEHHLTGQKDGFLKEPIFLCKNLSFLKFSTKPGFCFWTYKFQGSRFAR